MSGGPEPKDFKSLQADFAWRKRRYLRMLASQHEDALKSTEKVPAKIRKFLLDREVLGEVSGKAWVRLRTRPKSDWHDRLTQGNLDAKNSRVSKQATLWTDDPVMRYDGGVPEEDVNVIMARLAIDPIEAAALENPDGLETAPWKKLEFPPDYSLKLPEPNERASVKVLLQIVLALAIVQVGGDDKDPMHGKDIREVILHHLSEIVYHPDDQKVIDKLPADPLASLVTLMEKFLRTLHEPVESPATLTQSDIFITGWMHSFKEVDTSLLLKEYGLELSTRLLTLRHYSPNTEQSKQFVDLLAWLAMIAQEPLRVSLPAVSDMLAFKGRPAWTQGSWDCKLTDTSYGPPAPAPADSLAGEDDTLYRTLVCQAGNAGPDQPRYFRMPDRHPKHPRLPPPVLSGWSWPAKNDHKNFMYWWRSVLRPHCAEHLLALKETADFHSAFLLRFCYLFQLFSAQPDPRVPRYVAACIKASLLQFKYWWDEPAADDADEKVREMTFWSENHQIQFHASQFLAGQLFPQDVFPRSGKAANGMPITGSEHLKKGRARLEHWLDRRLAMGFSEWNAPGYYNEDFPSLLSLVDFSLDKTIANKAAMVTDLMVFDLARNTCRGSFGVTAGRAYFEHKAYGWEQSVGEAIEVLFGTRGDHLANEATAIAFCTSLKYQVPDALLAIGRDRVLLDPLKPMEFRTRVSIGLEEAQEHGIGFESDDDATFWWGLGAYFDPKTLELTRSLARRHRNLPYTNPPGLLFTLDKMPGFLGSWKAILQDGAAAAAGGAGVTGSSFLLLAPFPLNILAGMVHITSISLLIEGLWNLIEDLAIMIKDAIKIMWNFVTLQDAPKPDIPEPALQRAWEAMLQMFNAGNILSRANLYTYSVGDAMLSSAQNHHGTEISLQKQPWLASLGCDACVWTNAPMDPNMWSLSSMAGGGWEIFKRIISAQFSRGLIELFGWAQIGEEDLRSEGLRDWGGSISLPKIAQHRGAAIIAYEFPAQRSAFSATYTHAWFPSEFFDEVSPLPESEDWLASSDGRTYTWVFGRKDDGYIALCSARRIKWVRDMRFADDPDPASPDTVGQGRFTSTELRADDGSNVWICVIGNRTQFGSFETFMAKIRSSYVDFSGVGRVAYEMPAAPGTGEPGFRWDLFVNDNAAHLNGVAQDLDNYPRFEGRYVAGRKPGRVEWRETSYKIIHPTTGLWVSHDTSRSQREVGPLGLDTLLPQKTPSPLARAAASRLPIGEAAATKASPRLSGRARRFRLEHDD